MINEVGFLARLIIGGVWVYAGSSKLIRHTSLTTTLEGFGIHNPGLIRVVNKLAPWFEIVIGLGLLSGFLPGIFAGISLLLLLTFTALFVRVIRSGETLSCNCFGGHNESISLLDVVRNLFLAMLSAMAAFSQNGFTQLHYPAIVGAIPLFFIPFALFFQIKLLTEVGKNIKRSENEVFNDYYGSSMMMSLARWFRVEGS